MKQRRKTPHILDLTGPELLRLLVQVNCSILASWCPGCLTFLVKSDENTEELTYAGCGTPRYILDDRFWERANIRIRRGMKADKMLLRTVKSEWESVRAGNPMLSSPPHPFPAPLSWLKEDWQKAEAPSNRPVESGRFYRLTFMIERFRDLGLTQSEILEILSALGFPDGPAKAGRKRYANIRGENLRELSAIYWRSVGPPPDPAELWRIMQWVRGQKTSLLSRLRGDRVRQTKIPLGQANWGSIGRLHRPTEQDEYTFKMVSVFVRQEGFTKEEAINRFAVAHGFEERTEEISRSLERVWDYESAIVERLAGRSPESEEFWLPGILRHQLNRVLHKT